MSSATSPVTADRLPAHGDRRWLILIVVAIAQLMVVLDSTIVNIALPSAQRALGFPNSDRQWVVTAYALAFGSLLLVGGRLGDMFSRERVFITGLIGFAVASAIGGASVSFTMLAASRALQGAFGAVLAPSALGTLVSTFREPRERGRAFGVFSVGCSPSTCRGAGCCMSTWCSPRSRWPARWPGSVLAAWTCGRGWTGQAPSWGVPACS
jgi:MFS family permease